MVQYKINIRCLADSNNPNPLPSFKSVLWVDWIPQIFTLYVHISQEIYPYTHEGPHQL